MCWEISLNGHQICTCAGQDVRKKKRRWPEQGALLYASSGVDLRSSGEALEAGQYEMGWDRGPRKSRLSYQKTNKRGRLNGMWPTSELRQTEGS